MLTEKEEKQILRPPLSVATLNYFCLCLPNRDHFKRNWSTPSTNRNDVDSIHFLSSVSIHKIECLLNWFYRITKAYFYQDRYSEASVSRGDRVSREPEHGMVDRHIRVHTLQPPRPSSRPSAGSEPDQAWDTLDVHTVGHVVDRSWGACPCTQWARMPSRSL